MAGVSTIHLSQYIYQSSSSNPNIIGIADLQNSCAWELGPTPSEKQCIPFTKKTSMLLTSIREVKVTIYNARLVRVALEFYVF